MQADKTSNFYEMTKEHYEKTLLDNVTKGYKQCKDSALRKVNLEAKEFAEHFCVDDKLEVMAEQPCFFTIKDHKDDFRTNPKYRLINPNKSELGLLSKRVIEDVNDRLRNRINVNQWQSSSAVIKWFKEIPEKADSSFLIFDVQEFYPSIRKTLLCEALEFAGHHVEISRDEEDLIMHVRKSLLFHNNLPWAKKKGGMFDVTMGSYDGAEVCELVGLYILHQISQEIEGIDVGLYRDDGLAVMKNPTGPELDYTRKKLHEIFKNNGLKIDIKCGLKVVDYLDVTFDLNKGIFKPYIKPNNSPLYVNAKSNHPPHVLKQIPVSISKRISNISSDEEVFNKSAPYYTNALKQAGHVNGISYRPDTGSKRKNRPRKIIWFVPPYSKSVSTNVARTFLNIVRKHFPTNTRFSKLYNKNNVKASYSCMPNIARVIKSHNSKILNGADQAIPPSCSCQKSRKADCPLGGKCTVKNIVYAGTVTTPTDEEGKVYLGASGPSFKLRLGNHKKAFANKCYRKDTKLSGHIWDMKESGESRYSIKWSVVRQTHGYNRVSKTCDLCLSEKLEILNYKDRDKLLNARSEVVSKCRHFNQYLLKEYK